jgi:hypothetical protein
MKIGEHGLGDHIRLLAPLFAFIGAVWALRLVLYAGGAPRPILYICSVTVAGSVSVLLAAVLIHSRRFGSYTNVVAAVFLLNCWQQFLIVAAITFTALTNIQNVYSAPEFSFSARPPFHGPEGYLPHILGHLIGGVGFGTLFGSAMGSLVFWMLRRLAPKEARS